MDMTRPPFFMLALALAACGNDAESQSGGGARPFQVTEIATFDEPWAMTFLPDGRLLVSERPGRLKLLSADGRTASDIGGVPKVAVGGQGGLGDVVLDPSNSAATVQTVYLSWAEPGPDGTKGAAVGRAALDTAAHQLRDLKIIWRQSPKVTGNGHFGHRLAFSPDGQYLFITSGERQKFSPAQDMTANLGKTVRLRLDGSVPPDNPFADRGGVAAQIWSLGHRNALGIAFDADGRLWQHEMGPRGGDEVNLVRKGANYGWPAVSNGDHYEGRDIPDHGRRPEFEGPKLWWNPSISPAGMIVYTGDLFPQWKGSMLMGALSGSALVRIALDGEAARKAEQWDMGARIREVEQGPDGAVWLLEDGPGARLLKLTPR
jgi:glucose/arabinose dehydrogenase